MLISEAGEFGLIASITRLLKRNTRKDIASWQNLIIGPGDDTAAWKTIPGINLATTDIMVEGIHFDLSTTDWHSLGWKAMAVNISDIAAMGGIPQYALVSLALPGNHSVTNVLSLYKGMINVCNIHDVAIAGGNISDAEKISVNITLTGTCRQNPLTRSSAAAGDLIAVTGYPGLSSAGLSILKGTAKVPLPAARLFTGAHLRPVPQVTTGLTLAQMGVMTAVDTSDGLIADLTHICEASKCSATVYSASLPIHPMLNKYFPRDYLKLALSGGEDYELLFTANRNLMQNAKSRLTIPVTIIGEITSGQTGKISVQDMHGKPVHTSTAGWDHYRQQSYA